MHCPSANSTLPGTTKYYTAFWHTLQFSQLLLQYTAVLTLRTHTLQRCELTPQNTTAETLQQTREIYIINMAYFFRSKRKYLSFLKDCMAQDKTPEQVEKSKRVCKIIIVDTSLQKEWLLIFKSYDVMFIMTINEPLCKYGFTLRLSGWEMPKVVWNDWSMRFMNWNWEFDIFTSRILHWTKV